MFTAGPAVTVLPEASVVLAVNPLPVLNVAGQNVICVGNSATLTASGALTYTWTNGITNEPNGEKHLH